MLKLNSSNFWIIRAMFWVSKYLGILQNCFVIQRPPPSPRETGLALTGQDSQQQKKQKLMNERQQEYNDMLAKVCFNLL